jgi:hypothetical protein
MKACQPAGLPQTSVTSRLAVWSRGVMRFSSAKRSCAVGIGTSRSQVHTWIACAGYICWRASPKAALVGGWCTMRYSMSAAPRTALRGGSTCPSIAMLSRTIHNATDELSQRPRVPWFPAFRLARCPRSRAARPRRRDPAFAPRIENTRDTRVVVAGTSRLGLASGG